MGLTENAFEIIIIVIEFEILSQRLFSFFSEK